MTTANITRDELRASASQPRWRVRGVLALTLIAVLAVTVRPRELALASAFLLVACLPLKANAQRVNRLRLGLFVVAVVGATGSGALPLATGILLVFLEPIGVPAFIGLCDMLEHFGNTEPKGLDQLIGRMLVAEWAIRSAAVAGVLLLAAIDGSWLELTIAALPTLLMTVGKRVSAIVTGTVVGAVFGFSSPLIIPLTVGLGELVWWYAPPRLPALRIPLPRPARWRAPAARLRLWRIDRLVRRGEADSARVLISNANTNRWQPWFELRLGLVALETSDLQLAIDAAKRTQEHVDQAVCVTARLLMAESLLAIGRPQDALLLVTKPGATDAPPLAVTRNCVVAAALLATGNNNSARQVAEDAVAHCRRRNDSGALFRAHRLVMEAARRASDKAAAERAASRAMAAIGTRWLARIGSGRLDSLMLGRRGSQFIELARLLGCSERIELESGKSSERSTENLLESSVPMYFAMTGQWQDYSDLELLRSRVLSGRGESRPALNAALQAVRELDRTRYTLRSQADRSAWSGQMRDGLALAMDLAERTDRPQALAELLELARIQAIPRLGTPRSSEDIDLATPPVVRVRGRTSIPRYHDPKRPAPVDLEVAAMATAGPSAWWLSYWPGEGSLFWSLVPPSGRCWAGRIDAGDGSPLAHALDELRAALPVPLANESPAAMDVRMAQSALDRDVEHERRLSTSLGRLLLPRPLVAELNRRSGDADRLRLAISPAPNVGFVPWGLLVVSSAVNAASSASSTTSSTQHSRKPVSPRGMLRRLVDAADWALAPSAALSAELGARPHVGAPLPLKLAVLDTYGNDAELAELPGARAIAHAIPADAELLGGRHWTTRVATKPAVLAALLSAGQKTSALFACHAINGQRDRSSSGGLVLSSTEATGSYDLLTANDLFALANGNASIPAQIYLQACDTSDLGSASSGEWLTVAPAFLAAGAQAVCTTLFPIPDCDSVEDPILSGLISGADLAGAVRDLQRDALRRWESRQAAPPGGAASPLAWASYAITTASVASPAEVRRFSESLTAVTHESLSSVRRFLAGAAKTNRELRGRAVSTADLLVEYLDRTDLVDASTLRLFGLGLGLPIAARVVAHGLPRQIVGGAAATDELVSTMRQAQADAKAEGHTLRPGHIARASFHCGIGAHRVVRLLNAAGIQSPSQIANLIDDDVASSVSSQPAIWPDDLGGRLAEHEAFVDALLAKTGDASVSGAD